MKLFVCTRAELEFKKLAETRVQAQERERIAQVQIRKLNADLSKLKSKIVEEEKEKESFKQHADQARAGLDSLHAVIRDMETERISNQQELQQLRNQVSAYDLFIT